MENIGVSLSFNRDRFFGGDMVSGLLRFHSLAYSPDHESSADAFSGLNATAALSAVEQTSIQVQACGSIFIDPKWSKLYRVNDYIDSCIEEPILEYPSPNVLPTSSSSGYAFGSSDKTTAQNPSHSHSSISTGHSPHLYYVYLSNIQSHTASCSLCSLSAINPLLIQFDLPSDAMPSHRGLSFSVNYRITVVIATALETKQFSFQFPVVTVSAALKQLPYRTKISSISLLPAAALFQVNDGLCFPRDASDGGCPMDKKRSSSNIYNITDRDVVCQLEVDAGNATSSESSRLLAQLYFGHAKQPCSMVTASVVQSEIRFDGSIVQDKTLYSISKPTLDASLLVMDLQLPQNATGSFDYSFVKICYRVEFDFFLPKANGISKKVSHSHEETDPLRFTLPLVIQAPSGRSMTQSSYEEALHCLEPAMTLTYSY